MGSDRIPLLSLMFGLVALACQDPMADAVPPGGGPDASPSMFATGVCLREWCWEQPLPFGPQLPSPSGFWAASPDDAWAIVGRALVRWKDGRWQVDEGSEVRAPLKASDPNNVIVATAEGAMHFDGVEWSPMAGCPKPVALWVAGPANAWLAAVEPRPGGLSDVVLHHWNGASCEPFQFFENAQWALLDGAQSGDGWLALQLRSEPPPSEVRGQVLRWNGSTWTAVLDTEYVSELVAVTSDLAWLVADSWLWRWDGAEWSKTTTQYVYQLWFTGPTDGWASTGYGAAPARSASILRWGGTEWSSVHSEPDYPVYLFGAGNEDLLGALPGGRGAHWNGDAWTPTLPTTDALDLVDIAVGPSGEVWAVSAEALLRRSDGAWELVDQGGGTTVWSGVEGEAWVGGAGGLSRWADGWHPVSLPDGVDGPVAAVWGAAPGDVFVATAEDLSRWSGSGWAWSRTAPQEVGTLKAVHGSGADDVWILGSSGVARVVGEGWEVANLPPCHGRHFEDLWVEAPDRVVVVGRGSVQNRDVIRGTIELWNLGGAGWTCATVGDASPVVHVATCDGAVWIATEGDGVGRVVLQKWEPSEAALAPTAITCGAGLGLWVAGRGGQIAHRPSRPISR